MEIKDINIALCMDHLQPSNAMLVLGTPLTAIPLDKVEEVTLEWGPFPTAEQFPMFKAFLRWFTWPTNAQNANQPKSYVDGKSPNQPAFEIKGQQFFGRWRMSGVRERRQQTAPNVSQYFISVTLRLGFLQAFDWTEVLLAEGWTSPGNASAVTAPDAGSPIDDTVSNDPEEVLMLRLANVDPTRMFAIAKTINALVTGTLTIEGQPHGTDWHFIVAHPQRQQDGSGTIEFMVAKPQFTINAFQDNNTSREVSVGYLWQVPKALAQTIITAWDAGAGRSASASYGKDARLVDIVLTAVVGRANLTTPWRQINCNTWVRYHYAWG
ncbi:MAG: hypothetical protein IT479_13325, partial [Xanthomonadales bacterium]|nr:hypothetical protein [Xanthomonadales bacterium]